jgi:hypothetical protein
MAVKDAAGIGVDLDLDALPRLHAGELRFLVVGDDIGGGDGTTAMSCVPAVTNCPTRKATILSKRATLATQDAVIASANATLAVDQPNLAFAEQEDKRYSTLAASGYGTVKSAQQAASNIAASRAIVLRDNAAFDAARGQIDYGRNSTSGDRPPRPRSSAGAVGRRDPRRHCRGRRAELPV